MKTLALPLLAAVAPLLAGAATCERTAAARPPLVVEIERGPGQREDRFAHLLSGVPAPMPAAAHTPVRTGETDERIAALEARVAALEAALAELTGRS